MLLLNVNILIEFFVTINSLFKANFIHVIFKFCSNLIFVKSVSMSCLAIFKSLVEEHQNL